MLSCLIWLRLSREGGRDGTPNSHHTISSIWGKVLLGLYPEALCSAEVFAELSSSR